MEETSTEKQTSVPNMKPHSNSAIEVHVIAHIDTITNFMESERTRMICFRCGECGHLRHQCFSYKVRLCWHHKNDECYDQNCAFAHGLSELRDPWTQKCVRVVRNGGRLICIGCNSTEHAFRRCPMYRDLVFL